MDNDQRAAFCQWLNQGISAGFAQASVEITMQFDAGGGTISLAKRKFRVRFMQPEGAGRIGLSLVDYGPCDIEAGHTFDVSMLLSD